MTEYAMRLIEQLESACQQERLAGRRPVYVRISGNEHLALYELDRERRGTVLRTHWLRGPMIAGVSIPFVVGLDPGDSRFVYRS